MNKITEQYPDLINGFKKLDNNLVEEKAPRISWGKRYKEMSPEDKITYLEKLASTMNHAAYLIQNERNQLNDLCAKKEAQLASQQTSVTQNNLMLQTEITRMNEDRQNYNNEITALRAKIRALENGDID